MNYVVCGDIDVAGNQTARLQESDLANSAIIFNYPLEIGRIAYLQICIPYQTDGN